MLQIGKPRHREGRVTCLRSQSSRIYVLSIYYYFLLNEEQVKFPPAFCYEKFQTFRKKIKSTMSIYRSKAHFAEYALSTYVYVLFSFSELFESTLQT